MNGGDGAWVRQCAANNSSSFNVHMEEDQVRDTDRTGIPEMVSWFAFQQGAFGVLEFLNATKSATDEDGDGVVGPGELITYNVTINNLQADFAQADNGAGTEPEFIDNLNTNVDFESVVSASSGTLTYAAGTNRMEWQGAVPAASSVTLSYRVRVKNDAAVCSASDIDNQGQLNMDPIDDAVEAGDIDNLNQITEVSDDSSVDNGVDSDMDSLTDDDDPTLVTVSCRSNISVSKTDTVATYTPGGTATYTIVVTNAGPHNLIGATVVDNLPDGLTISGPVTCNITTGTGSCGTQSIVGNDISQIVNLDNGAEATLEVPVTYSTNPADY